MPTATKTVAWNGIQLTTPLGWEVIVSGDYHLLFEHEFHPLFELRWEDVGEISGKEIIKRGARFWGEGGTKFSSSTKLQDMAEPPADFEFSKVYGIQNKASLGGVCYSKKHSTLLVYMLQTDDKRLLRAITRALASIHLHYTDQILWRVQDFSFIAAPGVTLKNYTFRAGLTRLSFEGPDYQLHACRLSPADKRLQQQNLTEILTALTGAERLLIEEQPDRSTAYRAPTIFRQILHRLKREQPFISARAWVDRPGNRLLAIMLSSKYPIPQDTLDTHCNNYEIIQEIT